ELRRRAAPRRECPDRAHRGAARSAAAMAGGLLRGAAGRALRCRRRISPAFRLDRSGRAGPEPASCGRRSAARDAHSLPQRCRRRRRHLVPRDRIVGDATQGQRAVLPQYRPAGRAGATLAPRRRSGAQGGEVHCEQVAARTNLPQLSGACVVWQAELLPTTRGRAPIVLPARPLGARGPVVCAYTGGVGDRLCNLPALRALAAIFQGRLGLIGHHGDRALYYRDLELSAAWEIDLDLIATGWTFDAAALARKLRDCDLLLSVNPWHTDSVSGLLAHLPSIDTV